MFKYLVENENDEDILVTRQTVRSKGGVTLTRRKGTFIKASDAQKNFKLPLIGFVVPCINATKSHQFAPCVEISKGYLVTGKFADGSTVMPAWNQNYLNWAVLANFAQPVTLRKSGKVRPRN